MVAFTAEIDYEGTSKRRASMEEQSAEALSRLVHIEGTDFLFAPEYALRVERLRGGFSVSAHPNSFEGLPGENDFVGGRTPVTLASGLSGGELDRLFFLLDADFAHATEWMQRDAQEGFLGDVVGIGGWSDIRKCEVDYMLYLSGVGDEARHHTNDGGLSDQTADRMFAYSRERNADGVIGKGQPRDRRGEPSGDVMFGYDGALEQAIDKWIADGNLAAAALDTKP
ncbi:hypothetical protein D3C71_157370 [compost metagenome]